MSELKLVRDLAKQALIISTEDKINNFFWDHTERLVRNVECICRLPELSNSGTPIDHFCLLAAAYFSDAGAVYLSLADGHKTGHSNGNGSQNSDSFFGHSVRIASEKLEETVKSFKIEKICKIMAESANHSTKMTEAMILSDARNLDDMGAAGVFNEIRRCALSGKSIGDVLCSWQKKLDYQYWQARLKEGFQFEQVRKLAEQRLASTESFMNQLKIEVEGQDLEEFSLSSVLVS